MTINTARYRAAKRTITLGAMIALLALWAPAPASANPTCAECFGLYWSIFDECMSVCEDGPSCHVTCREQAEAGTDECFAICTA